MNSVFGGGSTSHSTVSVWFGEFRSGDFSLVNEPRGRPQPKVINEKLEDIVETDTSQTARELALEFRVSISTTLDYLRRINKVKKLDRHLYENLKHSASWLDKDKAPKHSPKPNIQEKKFIVTAWWNRHGSIHYSLIKPVQSIRAEIY